MKIQCKQYELKACIALDAMPSSLNVNQIGHKTATNKIKNGKISLTEEIRKTSSFSLDRSNKEHSKTILNECDLEKVTRGFSFTVSCWRRI